ncbi:hypothetical protein GCM10010182_33700 [Actinomadura cremea]|nr:hypothetical protein GCM10010182_33700 [Actinomadura cremea]
MPETEPYDDEEGLPHSCYLLEFSVSPGGARRGDVHVAATLDGLRESFEGRAHGADGYLVMRYGAVLHLWIVQEGEIVQGVDLHPFLRTGDARCDEALARVLALRGDDLDYEDEDEPDEDEAEDGSDGDDGSGQPAFQIMAPYNFHPERSLPLLAHAFALHDRSGAGDAGDAAARAELDRILADAEAGKAPESFGGVTVEGLALDLEAIAKVLPPLREPVLATKWVEVRWADGVRMHPETYLDPWGDGPLDPLHVGLNDLEGGEDVYL